MGVALTFDDGPHPVNTPALLDLLEQQGTSATFFVVGEMVKANPNVLKRTITSPLRHQVCNHSWSHPMFKKLTDVQVQAQIEDTQKQIEDTLGMCMERILRPPYGAITARQKQLVQDLGYTLEGWTVDPEDWKKPYNVQRTAQRILKDTKQGSVVLSHDVHATTVDAMKTVIPEL